MTMPVFEIPLPVALAAVACTAYWIGLKHRPRPKAEGGQTDRSELKRAHAVVRDLESVSQQIRTSLAEHHASLLAFKSRVSQLGRTPNEFAYRELAAEAERVLKPTQTLSKQISQAYDEIRQQTGLLLTFTELRTDPLTGLSNRRAMDELLSSKFALMARYNAPFAIAIVDVDKFKLVNDEHGHVYGDEVLQQVARLLQESARETDVVTRYGGEEFVIICPETDLSGVCILAERARSVISREMQVTVSAGVAMALDGDTTRSLLARADAALYSAKAGGRDRVYQHTGHHILPYHEPNPKPDRSTIRITTSEDDSSNHPRTPLAAAN